MSLHMLANSGHGGNLAAMVVDNRAVLLHAARIARSGRQLEWIDCLFAVR